MQIYTQSESNNEGTGC